MFFDSVSVPRRRQERRRPLRRASWIRVEYGPGLGGYFKMDSVTKRDANRCDMEGWCDMCDRSFLGAWSMFSCSLSRRTKRGRSRFSLE